MSIILLLLGIIIGGVCCYVALKPRIESTKAYNEEVEKINNELFEKNCKLLTDNKEIDDALAHIRSLVVQEETKKARLEGEIASLQSRGEDTAKIIFDNAMSVMQINLDESAQKQSEFYQQSITKYQDEYIQILQEASKELADLLKEQNEEIAAARSTLAELKSQIDAAIAANIRAEELKLNTSFYTLGIQEIDIEEIKKIRTVLPYIRNPRAINKAIWECYYRNATTDLVNRVVGSRVSVGIYKITCLLDNKIYIGQARDIGERFKQHIKCGLGIDAPNNKLYTAMWHDGVENFSFEVLEQCPHEKLNELEKYWIEFYQSNKYGYNMSAGGAKS